MESLTAAFSGIRDRTRSAVSEWWNHPNRSPAEPVRDRPQHNHPRGGGRRHLEPAPSRCRRTGKHREEICGPQIKEALDRTF